MTNDSYIGVRVPRELADALAARAAEERYSLSDEVRRALWLHTEALRSDEPACTGSIANGQAVEEPTRERV